jgi:GT2 family glycosyltransferase
MAPLLSVMMPVYNGAAYIRDAVDSILQQTIKDFELLIMDDGSVDNTREILAAYAERDSRVRLFPRPRQGQIACRNELLQLARSGIVACADADDVYLPDRLEQQIAVMKRDSNLLVLGTATITIDGLSRRRRLNRVVTGSAEVAARLKQGCCIAHPSCMMRRAQILRIGAYREAYQSAEDYDLFLRASEHGKVDNLPVVGIFYREHDQSESQRYSQRQAISADLARATHALRIAKQPDPTDGMMHPPPLEDPMLAALLPPERMALHRAMAIALKSGARGDELESASRYFLSARIDKKQSRACQRAMIELIGKRRWHRSNLGLAARAIGLGPGRLARLLWRMHRRSPAMSSVPR